MTHAILGAARLRGDPAADTLVSRLGPHAWAVVAMMRGVRRSDEPLPAALPPEARRFFAEEGLPPTWMDRGRVLRAQRWANDHLFDITTALFCASLPTAYAAERGSRVLAATGRMEGDTDKRVNETARFVLDVLARGSLEPGGPGLRAIQKTRFVHAAVRRALVERAADGGEVPINQEDLLGTLLTFSVIVIRAVRRLGVAVDERDADDFFHLWRAVGAMMGIEEKLLPVDFAEATERAGDIADRHFQPSPHGRALMAVLLTRIEAHVPGLPRAPRFLVRHLAGDRVADLLGVPPAEPAPMLGLESAVRLAQRPARDLLRRATPLLARPLLAAIVGTKLRVPAT
jgi:hypothetical protein